MPTASRLSESVMPAMSGHDQRAVTQDPGDRAILIVPLAAPLADGQYTVSWQIVAADGHKTKGTYHFISEK